MRQNLRVQGIIQQVQQGLQPHHPTLAAWSKRLNIMASGQGILWVLLSLGLLRSLFLLAAYSPAHGSDSYLYMLQAEQLAGNLVAPRLADFAHPLYPYFILFTYKGLGSLYWTVGIQAVVAGLLPLLFYITLKRYSPLFALFTAIILLFDVQTAIMFNFTSTEPLYITLLLLSICGLLIVLEKPRQQNPLGWLFALGALIALTALARPVARFLIIPLSLIVFWRLRNWRALFMLLLGFAIIQLGFGQLQRVVMQDSVARGVDSGTSMIEGIAQRQGGMLSADHGPYSAIYLSARDDCNDTVFNCLTESEGSTQAALNVMVRAMGETIAANIVPYSQLVFQNTLKFLAMDAGQYRDIAPASVQCIGIEAHLDGIEAEPRDYIWGRFLEDYSAQGRADLRELMSPFVYDLCPPTADSALARGIVDGISSVYGGLAQQSSPLISYPLLLFLVLLLPWAREHYLTLVLVVGVTLMNHAAISAVILNVQPRYVAVVNSMRWILLCLLVFILLKIAFYALDGLLSNRAPDPH